MKRALFASLLVLGLGLVSQAQEYMIVTTIESIVPGGVGRSRIVIEGSDINVDDFTTERTDGKKSKQSDVDRGDAKIDKFTETKLLNFYSMVGINFQNIASNDALVADRLTKLTQQGWELKFVTSAVESDAGKQDGDGIFITRYIFYK